MHLNLELSASRGGNKYLLSKLPSLGVLLWQPEGTNTPCLARAAHPSLHTRS